MKILQINSVYNFGSTGRIVKDLKSTIEQSNNVGAVIYGRGIKNKENNVWKIGNDFDFKAHALYTRLTDKHGLGSTYITKKIIEKILNFNPDILHLHNIHGYYINIQLLFDFLKKYDKPVVWTLHDCWSFTGHCSHFDYIKCEKWLSKCYSCPQTHAYPKSYIDNSVYNYDLKKQLFLGLKRLHIVTPSKWLQSLVKQSFLQEYNCSVVNNGIDLEVFRRKKYSNINENRFIILGVASIWDDRKGFNDFIKLYSLMDKSQYKIIMVGVNYKQKLILEKLGITGIERTNNVDELVDLYNKANIFFNPTYEDNFPTTNIESLACGTPVITYSTGGSPESITDECGLVIEKGRIDKVLIELEKLKKHNFPSDICVQHAINYDKSVRFKEYLDLYISLL